MQRTYGGWASFIFKQIKSHSNAVHDATYRAISKELLPTPSKSHYLFNTRDVAKIIQGVMQATKQFYDSCEPMLQLWCHETFRIIGDRMWDMADKDWLQTQLDGKLSSIFSTNWESIFAEGQMPPFVSFMRQMEHPPFEAVTDMGNLKVSQDRFCKKCNISTELDFYIITHEMFLENSVVYMQSSTAASIAEF